MKEIRVKIICAFILVLIGYNAEGQRFTFNPEIGAVCSQVDGDWLQGFDKSGLTIGVGSHYYISDAVILGFSGKYMNLGSDVSASRQDSPPDGVQFTSSFSAASLGFDLVIAPFNPKFRFGAGLSLNRIFNFEYNPIVFQTSTTRVLIDEERMKTNYVGYKFFMDLRLFEQAYSRVSFQKSFNSLIGEPAEDMLAGVVRRIVPYYLSFTVFYEFEASGGRKTPRKKKRRVK